MPIRAVGITLLAIITVALIISAVSGMIDSGVSELVSTTQNAPKP